MATERLLHTPEEAAEVLRIGRTTLYALMSAGQLRPVHIGRACRISRAELERYVSGLEAPASPAPMSPSVPMPIPRRRVTAAVSDQARLFDDAPTSPDVA